MGEEAGQQGAKTLSAREKFDFAIVGEPTRLQIVNTHKGAVVADASRARSGRARLHAAEWRKCDRENGGCPRCLRRELQADFASQIDQTLGAPSFNIGTIHGGAKINIVPDACEVLVDIRTIPGQDLSAILDSLAKSCSGLEIERIKTSGPLKTDPAHPMIGMLESCGARCTGAPWFCDAAIFAAAGTPAVALGPGSIEQAHTADEWISVADLEAGVVFFRRLLQSL